MHKFVDMTAGFRTIAVVALCLFALTANGQQERSVYYFLDAVMIDSAAQDPSARKVYLYSFPVVRTTQGEFDADKILDAFKKKVKEEYGFSTFTSAVVRVNDSYDEVRNLITRYLEKYKSGDYKIVEIASTE